MSIKRNAKRFAKTVLTQPLINKVIRRILALRHNSLLIPDSVMSRMPVVGETKFHLSNGKELVLVNDGNDTIASRLHWLGLDSFEPETIRLLHRLLPGVNTFFDIGANTGVISLLAAIDDSRRSVHAFEPVPWIADAMKRNVAANKLSNIHVSPTALTDFDGEIELYIPMDVGFPTGASSVAGYRAASKVIKAPTMRLDMYVSTNGITGPLLLKIDTETTEPAVLAGGMETLQQFKPIIICEVLPGSTEAELHRMLDGLEYVFFHITENGLVQREQIVGDPRGTHLNYLFVPKQRQPALVEALGF